jgi:hypothetical protein
MLENFTKKGAMIRDPEKKFIPDPEPGSRG